MLGENAQMENLFKSIGRGSVQFSHSVMSDSLWPHRLQHTRLPCPSPPPGVCLNSCPASGWCHPTISSSVRGRKENSKVLFNMLSLWVIKIIDMRDHLKCYFILKGLGRNFLQAWSGYHGKAVSSDVCFNSRKSLLLGHQMICGSSQCLVLSGGMSHESMNLFLGILWHKNWHHLMLLIFPIRLKRILLQSSFPVDKISRLQGVMLKGAFLPRYPCKKLLYQNMAIFNRSIRALQC